MRTCNFLKPFLSFSLPISTPRTFHSISSPFSNLSYAHGFLSLLTILSKNPTNPRLLTALDSMLSQAHLLDSTTSVLVLRGLSLTRKLNRAKPILSNLNKRSNIPNLFLYSLVLQCLLRERTIHDVETVWRDISSGSSHRAIDVSDFVVYLCRHGEDSSELERGYRRILSSGWSLSLQGYVALIGAMCRKDKANPSLARFILNEMEEKGLEADGLTYFALFQSFCRAGKMVEADSVLRDWINRRNFELDASIFGNFFYGLCKSGKFREARKLFDKLTKKDRDGRVVLNSNPALKPGRRVIFQLITPGIISETMAFESYFRSSCSARRVDEAERLFKLAMKKSTVPEICVYTSFIKALFRAGRPDDALKFFEAERKKGHVSSKDIAVAVIFGLCEIGSVDDGYKLLCEMVSEEFVPTARVWNRILESYWEGGMVEKAMGIFEGMRSGSCSGCATRPDAETYGVMIRGFLGEGEVEMGISLLEEMVREKFKANVDLYSGIVRGLHASGKLEESNKYLNRMIENGILVSYDQWESLYDSMTMEGGGDDTTEFWKSIVPGCQELARGNEKRRLKR